MRWAHKASGLVVQLTRPGARGTSWRLGRQGQNGRRNGRNDQRRTSASEQTDLQYEESGEPSSTATHIRTKYIPEHAARGGVHRAVERRRRVDGGQENRRETHVTGDDERHPDAHTEPPDKPEGRRERGCKLRLEEVELRSLRASTEGAEVTTAAKNVDQGSPTNRPTSSTSRPQTPRTSRSSRGARPRPLEWSSRPTTRSVRACTEKVRTYPSIVADGSNALIASRDRAGAMVESDDDADATIDAGGTTDVPEVQGGDEVDGRGSGVARYESR
ncbi:hypothetical protein JVT61DRAFT_8053 [Boletus reticuloceps]|uniref:Uncharacterized protein n=1 Tax=Boletus reticuloceps TaxID=495285 RepID=A0A8I2YHQ4_9AGAM|nr:hypothetical protein JVT61DRAFT_8053 [Boletus reticuloceps]